MNQTDYRNLDRWIINGSTWEDTFRRPEPDPDDEDYAYLDEGDSYEDYLEGERTEAEERYYGN